eukprot:gene9588-10575_t
MTKLTILLLLITNSFCQHEFKAKYYEYDGLTIQEQSCTTMRSGLVRFQKTTRKLEVCLDRKWQPYGPEEEQKMRLHNGLIGHWKMDEESGTRVDDDSGYENHGTAAVARPSRGKFTRARYFDSKGLITIPNTHYINFGTSSFSVGGWTKILDIKYPRTSFAVTKTSACYLGRTGWNIGHGYNNGGTEVCICDQYKNKVRSVISHDQAVTPAKLLGRWAHYMFVFDRGNNKIKLYINGVKQRSEVDISSIKGGVNNDKPLVFGYLHGWTTKGYLDDFRLYNIAINDKEAAAIHADHRI